MGLAIKCTDRAIYLTPVRQGPPVDLRPGLLPGLRVHPATGRAWLPRSPHLAAAVLDRFRDGIVQADAAFWQLASLPARLPELYRYKTEPLPDLPPARTPRWRHQEQALSFVLALYRAGFPAAGVWSDRGTGKTRVAVDVMDALEVRRVLVVGPMSSLRVWYREIRKHASRSYLVVLPVLGTDIAERTRIIALRTREANIPYVVVVNYDMVVREPFSGWALDMAWDLIILDEIHRIKAPTGKISRYLARLGQTAKYRLGLTGTPLHHTPLDIWAQYRFLDPGIFCCNYVDFEKRYGPLRHPSRARGHEDLEQELHEKMYSIAYRVSQDVLSLPEATHQEIIGYLSTSSRSVYQELEDQLVADIGTGRVTAKNALVQLIKLQQITSGFIRDDNGIYHRLSTEKMDLLTDWLEDLPKEEPAVIFAEFLYDLDRIMEVVRSSGRRSAEVSGRRKELATWQQGEAEILVAQIGAAAEAEDFSRARYAVYYSSGWSLGEYVQSLARLHRPGQTRPVTYYHLLIADTVDVIKHRLLMARRDLVEGILDHLRRRDEWEGNP